jgi:predicted aspartyl protease
MLSSSVLFFRSKTSTRPRQAVILNRPAIPFILFLAVFLYVFPGGAAAGQIQLRGAPDDAATEIESVQGGEIGNPLAESIGAGGVRWYLVKTKNGAHGWVKGSDLEAAQLENFLRSLPQPPLFIPSEIALSAGAQKTVIVPVHMTGTAVIVPVTLNRRVQTHMILDTGASLTVLSRQVAAQLNLQAGSYTTILTANGVIRVPLAHLNSLHVSDAAATDLTVAIHDFSPNPHIGGLLGLDYLSRFHTSLDSRRNRLTLAPR